MSATPQYLVRADLVTLGVNLLSAQSEIRLFSERVDGDFQQQAGVDLSLQLGLSTPIAPAVPSRTLMFPQDRIILNLSPGRSVILREYPSVSNLQEDIDRLSTVAGLAIECTRPENKQTLQSYGYNMQVIFNKDVSGSAIEYLGGHLFNRNFLGSMGRKHIGGSAVLVLEDGGVQWTFRVEPWPAANPHTDRVSVSINRHSSTPAGLPTKDKIGETLLELWGESGRFMSNLQKAGEAQ